MKIIQVCTLAEIFLMTIRECISVVKVLPVTIAAPLSGRLKRNLFSSIKKPGLSNFRNKTLQLLHCKCILNDYSHVSNRGPTQCEITFPCMTNVNTAVSDKPVCLQIFRCSRRVLKKIFIWTFRQLYISGALRVPRPTPTRSTHLSYPILGVGVGFW